MPLSEDAEKKYRELVKLQSELETKQKVLEHEIEVLGHELEKNSVTVENYKEQLTILKEEQKKLRIKINKFLQDVGLNELLVNYQHKC